MNAKKIMVRCGKPQGSGTNHKIVCITMNTEGTHKIIWSCTEILPSGVKLVSGRVLYGPLHDYTIEKGKGDVPDNMLMAVKSMVVMILNAAVVKGCGSWLSGFLRRV